MTSVVCNIEGESETYIANAYFKENSGTIALGFIVSKLQKDPLWLCAWCGGPKDPLKVVINGSPDYLIIKPERRHTFSIFLKSLGFMENNLHKSIVCNDSTLGSWHAIMESTFNNYLLLPCLIMGLMPGLDTLIIKKSNTTTSY